MKNKPLTKIYLIKEERSTYLISGKIPDIIKQLQELAAKVPEEYRDQIEIELESFDYYGCPTISLDAYYYRPETEQERTERLTKEKLAKEQRDKYEREQFEILKKKFEGGV